MAGFQLSINGRLWVSTEDRSGQPLPERQMDDANNKAGRCAAQPFDEPGPKKSRIDKCTDLLRNGLLFGPGGVPMPYPQR